MRRMREGAYFQQGKLVPQKISTISSKQRGLLPPQQQALQSPRHESEVHLKILTWILTRTIKMKVGKGGTQRVLSCAVAAVVVVK